MNCKTMFFMIFLMSTNIESMQQNDHAIVPVDNPHHECDPITVGGEAILMGVSFAQAVTTLPKVLSSDKKIRERHATQFLCAMGAFGCSACIFFARNMNTFFGNCK